MNCSAKDKGVFFPKCDKNVRYYFKDSPNDFLEVCWENGQCWEEIFNFLGVKRPLVPFPHENQTQNRLESKNRGFIMYKVLISYSKSHIEMSNIFKKSFHSVNRNSNFTLIEDYIQNQVGNGNYSNPFFSEMVQQKVISISNLLDKIEDGEIIIFSDVDIILARDFSSEVEKYMSGDIDFACQTEYESKFGGDEYCTGFMFIRNSQRIRDFMVKLREKMVETNYFDQNCFNLMKDLINYRKLPSTYFNISHGLKARCVWKGNTLFLPPLPQNTAIVHANWTIGSKNKIKMMNHYWKELNNS